MDEKGTCHRHQGRKGTGITPIPTASMPQKHCHAWIPKQSKSQSTCVGAAALTGLFWSPSMAVPPGGQTPSPPPYIPSSSTSCSPPDPGLRTCAPCPHTLRGTCPPFPQFPTGFTPDASSSCYSSALPSFPPPPAISLPYFRTISLLSWLFLQQFSRTGR